MTTYKVAVLVGSLRKASFTRKAARLLMSLAPENLEYPRFPDRFYAKIC